MPELMDKHKVAMKLCCVINQQLEIFEVVEALVL